MYRQRLGGGNVGGATRCRSNGGRSDSGNGEAIVEVVTSGATETATGGWDIPFALAIGIDFPDGREVNAVGKLVGVGFPVGIGLKNKHVTLRLVHEWLGCLHDNVLLTIVDIRGEAKVADLSSLLYRMLCPEAQSR